MRDGKYKRIVSVIVLLTVMFLLASCSIYDLPPDDGTPEPMPHDGVFSSEYGTMTFNGDGENLIFDFAPAFAKAAGLPAGENAGSYVFLFQHGQWRYDKAERFRIAVSDVSYDFINDFTQTDENTIAILSPIDGEAHILFVKESD